MRKSIAKLLMLAGVLLLILPIAGGLYVKYEQQKLYKAYTQNIQEVEASIDVLNETLETGEVEVNDKQQEKESLTYSSETPNGVEVMGMITIPKLEVTLMLVEGVSKQALKYAVGHMPGTGMPGEVGNCALAGHRSYTFGEYFNRLDEVEIGDEIQITMGKENYTYKVYETFIVEPTEISVTESQGDRKVVTLITCHPVVKATHRLIVRGELVEE